MILAYQFHNYGMISSIYELAQELSELQELKDCSDNLFL